MNLFGMNFTSLIIMLRFFGERVCRNNSLFQPILLTFLFLCYFIFPLYGQLDLFEPGSIALANEDTISVLINRTSNKLLSRAVAYREADDSQIFYLSPSEVIWFKFTNSRKVYAPVSYTYIDQETGYHITEKRIAERLVQGALSLFRVERNFNEYKQKLAKLPEHTYYILRDGQFHELAMLEDQIDDSHFRIDKRYKGMLRFLLRDWPVYIEKTNNIGYNDHELRDIIVEYNTFKDPFFSLDTISAADKIIDFEIRGMSPLAYKESLFKGGFGFGIAFHFSNLSKSNSLSTGIGIEYLYSTFKVDQVRSNTEKFNNYRLPLIARLRFARQNTVKPFLSLLIIPEIYQIEGLHGPVFKSGIGGGAEIGRFNLNVRLESDILENELTSKTKPEEPFLLLGINYLLSSFVR